MRGRTNVGGGGLAINAVAVNKTVKSGNIIAGDFVEYYTDEQIIEQSNPISFIFNKGNYTIALKSNKLVLFKNNEQVDIYTNYNISITSQVYLYGDYILFSSNTNNNSFVIGSLSIDTQTDSFNIISVETITFSTYNYRYTSIAAGGGKILAMTAESGSNKRCGFVTADINSNGQISNIILTDSSGLTKSQEWILLEYYNNKFYCINYYSTNNSLTSLTIDSDGKVSFDNYGVGLFSYYSIKRRIYQNGRIVAYACSSTSGSSINYKIAIVDLVGVTYSLLSIDGVCISEIINGKLICANYEATSSKPTAVYLYSYNYNTQEVELINTLQVELNKDSISSYIYSSNAGNLINNSIILCKRLNSDRNVYEYKKLNLVGDSIEDIPDVDYVIPYTDGGHPIGVAKDPGTTDSVIGVYIPVPVE